VRGDFDLQGKRPFGLWTALTASALVSSIAAQSRISGVNSEGIALRVDPATGRGIRLSGVGLAGYAGVEGIAFDPAGTLFGLDSTTHELITIDWHARLGSPVGGIGMLGVGNLTYDPGRNLLYGIEVVGGASDRLVSIQPATGASTVIGSTGVDDIGGLAYDPIGRVLYATDAGNGDTLLRLNVTTGASTVVGPLGFVFVSTLTYDAATRTLYGIDQQGNRLIRVNTSTGQGTALPSTLGGGGFTDVRGLAVDPASGTLLGMDAATKQLLTIDKTSGGGTALGPLGANDLRALGYDFGTRTVWATDTRNDKLLRLDLGAGEAHVIGNLLDPAGQRLYDVLGLAYDPYRARLYGVDKFSKRLVILDRNTGRATSAVALHYPSGQPIFGARTLAFDLDARTLYLVDCDGFVGRLVRVDPLSGLGTLVSATLTMPFPNVDGLAYLAHADVLVASVDNNNAAAPARKLIQINPRNGQWSELFTLGVGRIYGLAYDPFSLALGGTNGSEFFVLQASGTGTAMGTLGALDLEGLAYDPVGHVLYGTSVGNATQAIGRLFTIDSTSGQGTPLGALVDAQGNGYTAVEGLAFDPNTRTLYGSDTLRDKLLRIDRLSGRVTPVGLLGFGEVAGLAFNPATNTLYGVDNATDRLIRINTTTGAGTAIGALGSGNVEGLEFDTVSGILYGSDTVTLKLLRINVTTGLATAVGTTGYKVDGLGGRIP
jgi:uncharacterized protein YjiK